MKRWAAITGLALLFLLTACEEVIEVEVPGDRPRLIVDGLIRVDEQEPYVPVRIALSESRSTVLRPTAT